MKKLEQIFDLPSNTEVKAAKNTQQAELQKVVIEPDISHHTAELDKVAAAIPLITGLGVESDTELDQLAKRAVDAYDDLMDLGMNVEARYSGRIFEVASAMLKNALDAKTAKIDKKIKLLDIQLKKQKLDKMTELSNSTDVPVSISQDGAVVSDRNSLIEKLKTLKDQE